MKRGITNRWTGARAASFSTCLARRRLNVIAAPGQLRRYAVLVIAPQLMSDQLFLSYSKKDSAAAADLCGRLRKVGYEVWFDVDNLLPGQDWEREIARAIRESAAVIICLSSQWVNDAGYIQKELRQTLEQMDLRPEGSVFLIPLKLDDCDVPDRLQKYHWGKLYEPTGFASLVQSIDLALNRHNVGRRIDASGSIIAATIGWSKSRRDAALCAGLSIPDGIVAKALVDTGASATCVDEEIVKRLALTPTGATTVSTPSGNDEVFQYDVGITLDGSTSEHSIGVLALSLSAIGFGALIGRDLLSHFRFEYDGPRGLFRVRE